MRIDLHADDLGASPSVNKNILSAWRAGGLHSASLLANGDALQEASNEINAEPSRPIRLIVHLNLSEGLSLAKPSEIPLLVDDSGRLFRGFMGLWKLWLFSGASRRQEFIKQVENEWRIQIQKVIDTFTPRIISGVDGHIHVHMLPFLFPIAIKLCREFDFREIRISREIPHFSWNESLRIGFLINITKHVLLNILAIPAKRIATENNISSPDVIAGVLYSGHMSEQTALASIKAARRGGLKWLEILFHPGRASPAEAQRWSGNPSIGKFYLDSYRDKERDSLINLARKQL